MQSEQPQNPANHYRENRYRPSHQAWVNQREQDLIKELLISYRLHQSSILDVPCGYGRLFPIYKHLDIAITGVDINQKMVKLASEHNSLDYSIHVLHGTIFNLPFENNSFDAVICVRLLHHQLNHTERQCILSEASRVSRHYIIISYYRFSWMHALSSIIQWRLKGRVPNTIKSEEIDYLFTINKLRCISTYYLLRHVHMQTFAVLEKRQSSI